MKIANIKNTAIFAAAFCALIFCACKNMYKSAEQKQTGILKAKIALPDTQEAMQNAARAALPSGFDNALVFAGAVTQDGNPASADLKIGAFNSSDNTLELPFLSSSKNRADYKLDIYAFANRGDVSDITKALLHGQTSITILADAGNAVVGGKIKMLSYTNSSGVKGRVDLRISIPAEYDFCAECKTHPIETISAVKDEANSNDEIWVYKITGELEAGAHNVNFMVKKSDIVVYAWNEALNVIPGFVTNKWISNNVDENGAKVVAVSFDNIFYVRGTPESEIARDSWFADFAAAPASDSNNGSIIAPFETVQKAIDAVLAVNDTKSEYTIYVDGILKKADTASTTAPVANITPNKALKLSIIGLGTGTNKTTLNGENRNANVVNIGRTGTVSCSVTLTNLKLTGGRKTGDGGGMYIGGGCIVTLTNCEVSGNTSSADGGGIYNNGKLTITGSTLSSNTANGGGGIYNNGGTVTLTNCTFHNNTAALYDGGGIHINGGTVTLNNCTFTGNAANGYCGGGIYIANGCTLTINGANFSNNTASGDGGAIYNNGTLNMQGNVNIPFTAVKNNDIYLDEEKVINITGNLTGDSGIRITPKVYPQFNGYYWLPPIQVLSGTNISSDKEKFTVTPKGAVIWSINNSGQLEKTGNKIFSMTVSEIQAYESLMETDVIVSDYTTLLDKIIVFKTSSENYGVMTVLSIPDYFYFAWTLPAHSGKKSEDQWLNKNWAFDFDAQESNNSGATDFGIDGPVSGTWNFNAHNGAKFYVLP